VKHAGVGQLSAVGLALVIIVAFGGYGILRGAQHNDGPTPNCQVHLKELAQAAKGPPPGAASLGYQGVPIDRALDASIVCETKHMVLPGLSDLATHGIVLTAPRGAPKITETQAIGGIANVSATLVTLRVNPLNFPQGSGEPRLVWAIVSSPHETSTCADVGFIDDYQACSVFDQCNLHFLDTRTGVKEHLESALPCTPSSN